MTYRAEIDGLRALAVVPVILFHADLPGFGGGFVGVDVFFVISGYLITQIILGGLDAGAFSLAGFYERRARRILPALLVVMAASILVGHLTLMPDEYKNLGQSLVATSLFSNNVLLAMTTGYWDLSGEFKPLLHTWSLGVEEQYYLAAPVLLMLAWRLGRGSVVALLALAASASIAFAAWASLSAPHWAFYSLPARAWEIALGGLAAALCRDRNPLASSPLACDVLALGGLAMVLASVFGHTAASSGSPSAMAVPVVGALLALVFARQGTRAQRLLSQPALVAIGLASYSLYLWHQPVFAFMRARAVSEPGHLAYAAAIALTSGLAYCTYRWVETPLRRPGFGSRRAVFLLSGAGSAAMIAVGLALNSSYGLPSRLEGADFKPEEMDKRLYNRRAFRFKRDAFSGDGRARLLIIGNSFGRDFTNLTLETFDTSRVEIIYRDDLRQGILGQGEPVAKALFGSADHIVFASGHADPVHLRADLDYAKANGKGIFYIGNKNFGYNLNWLITLSPEGRRSRRNPVPPHMLAADAGMAALVPPDRFISLLRPVVRDGAIPITDEEGRMLSTDRAHLTRYGAIYFGEKVVRNTPYADIFR